MIDLSIVTFPEFQHYVFLHNEKYHPSTPYTGSAGGILGHCIRLFQESGELLRLFPRSRVFEGLDFVSGGQGFFSTPADPAAGWDIREEFYLSMVALFRDLFSIDSMEHLGFMWFERMMVWSRDEEGRTTIGEPRLRAAMLSTMQGVLDLDSTRCQRAALHGLNHIHHEEPAAAERIIDCFLAKNPGLDEGIYRYARGCRTGAIRNPGASG